MCDTVGRGKQKKKSWCVSVMPKICGPLTPSTGEESGSPVTSVTEDRLGRSRSHGPGSFGSKNRREKQTFPRFSSSLVPNLSQSVVLVDSKTVKDRDLKSLGHRNSRGSSETTKRRGFRSQPKDGETETWG